MLLSMLTLAFWVSETMASPLAAASAGSKFSGTRVATADSTRTDTLSVRFYFRQGYRIWQPGFRENGARLEAFVRQVCQAQADTFCHVRTIEVTGASSPEGTDAANQFLARKRTELIDTMLRRRLSLPDSLFHSEHVGIDWAGLERLVEVSDMDYREEVLDILRNTPVWVIRNGKVVDGRKRQLGMLRGGVPWRYMEEHFFPELRGTSVDVACLIEVLLPPPAPEPEPVPEPVQETDTLIPADTVAPAPAEPERKPFYIGLKTNMLYDVALVPNLGAEVYLGKGWTAQGSWMYAWWRSDRKHRYWRTYGGEVGVRKYFGRKAAEKPLQGHHLGIYGQLLTYDFELGGRGYLGDKWSWGVGAEYGYSLPVARRLNIDFGIGVGYLGGEYEEYTPEDGHYVWQKTKQRHWFGPTKAEISLVWLIGRGNYNQGKGGKR